MALSLNMVSTSLQGVVMRKGARVFGLLGKAAASGLVPFQPNDLASGWALTAHYGCLRLERLAGDEEITGGELVLPTPFSYDYGIASVQASPELTRAIFGLLPSELEQLVTALRRGSFPVLGFSLNETRCSITGGIIPGYWPHLVISDMAVCGSVVSLETFARVMVSSLPRGHLSLRYPALQSVIKPMMRIILAPHPGLPYTKEVVEMAPAFAPTGKAAAD